MRLAWRDPRGNFAGGGARKTSKRFLSLLLSVCLLSGSFTAWPKAALAAQTGARGFDLQKTVKVNQNDLVIGGGVRYDVEVAYTRAEWIAFLSNLFGIEPFMPEQVDGELIDPAPLYTDIAGIPQEGCINAAVFNGILTDQGGAFRPNDPATRDFAAATAVRALGFGQEQKIVCDDSAEVSSPYEAYIAADIGLMPLLNNRFYPDSVLTRQEAEQIKATVEEINGSIRRTGSGGKGVVLQDGVISLDAGTPFTDDGTTLTLSSSIPALSGLKVGDIVVIGLQKAFKVTGIRRDGGNLVITYTEPEIQEFIDEIDTYGTGYLDFEHFQPAPGVSVIESDSDEPMAMALSIDGGQWLSDAGYKNTWPLMDGVKPTGFSLTLGMHFSNNKLYHGDKTVVNKETGEVETRNRYLIFDTTNSMSVSIDAGASIPQDSIEKYTTKGKEWVRPLGNIPVAGLGPGESLWLKLSAVVKADGSIGVTISSPIEVGVQVINNHVRIIKNFKRPTTALGLSGSASIGARFSLIYKLIGLELASVSGEIGLRGTVTGEGKWRDEEHVWCIDVSAGIYIEISAMQDTIFEDTVKIPSWEITPFSIGIGHFENLKPVDPCTFERGYIVGTVSELRTATPIAGAQIDVYSREDFSFVVSTTSDSLGQYRVKVKPGSYVVQVSKDGYDASGRSFVDVEEDEETELNLKLSKKATPTPSPSPTPKPTPTPTAVPVPPSGSGILLKNVLLTFIENDVTGEKQRPLSGVNVKVYQRHSNGSFTYLGGGMTDPNGQLLLDVTVIEDYFIDQFGPDRWDEIKFSLTFDQRDSYYSELFQNGTNVRGGHDFGFTLDYYNRMFKYHEEEDENGFGYCEYKCYYGTSPEFW